MRRWFTGYLFSIMGWDRFFLMAHMFMWLICLICWICRIWLICWIWLIGLFFKVWNQTYSYSKPQNRSNSVSQMSVRWFMETSLFYFNDVFLTFPDFPLSGASTGAQKTSGNGCCPGSPAVSGWHWPKVWRSGGPPMAIFVGKIDVKLILMELTRVFWVPSFSDRGRPQAWNDMWVVQILVRLDTCSMKMTENTALHPAFSFGWGIPWLLQQLEHMQEDEESGPGEFPRALDSFYLWVLKSWWYPQMIHGRIFHEIKHPANYCGTLMYGTHHMIICHMCL